MLAFLRPSSTLTQRDVADGLRLMTREGVSSATMFSLASGGFMAAYALALGANNFQIGVLAALPFFTQVMQLPAILLIERFRMRKALGIPCSFAAQLLWIPAGAGPFLLDTPGAPAVAAVIAPEVAAGRAAADTGAADDPAAGRADSDAAGRAITAAERFAASALIISNTLITRTPTAFAGI